MSHQIRHKQIFALLDGQLGSSGKRRLSDHLAGCSECTAYLEQIKRHRKMALEVSRVPEPDWSRIDGKIEQAITEATEKQVSRFGWAPVALTLAAAAAVALALALPTNHNATRIPLNHAALNQPVSAVDTAPLETAVWPTHLTARVINTLTKKQVPEVGQVLVRGDKVLTTEAGGVQVALGPSAEIESMGTSFWEVISLDADKPAIAFEQGRIRVSMPFDSFDYGRGLTIAASSASFHVLHGIVEFLLEGKSLMVTVSHGDVVADHGFGPVNLSPGTWRTVLSKNPNQPTEWIAMSGTSSLPTKDLESLLSELKERRVERPVGTLPRRVINQSLIPAKPQIRGCYEKALKRDPGLILSLDVRIKVGLHGTVSSVRVTGIEGQAKMEQCLDKVFKGLSFPPPRGGPLELLLPLRLYPEN